MSIFYLGLQVALILCVYGSNNADVSSCNTVKDCITCVSKKSWKSLIDKECNWCPQTSSCHAYKSSSKVCPADQNVYKTADCYNVPQEKYSPENAYINVLLSAVAYSDHPEACLKHLLPGGGFRLVAAIGSKCSSFIFDYKECFATITVSDDLKLIVVSSRGTTSTKQLLDEVLKALFVPKKPFKAGGHVQAYFYDAFYKLYPCITEYLKDLLNYHPNYNVAVTGHSLGGALASLTAVSLVYDNIVSKDKMELYTFGMPRVGDKTHAMSFDNIVKSSWRVVHSNDIVARLPTKTNVKSQNKPYHHKTEVYYPAVDMPPDAKYKVCALDEDPTCVNSNPFTTNKTPHIEYFNIHVGKACSNIGPKRKRSDDGEEISAMADLFTEKTCTVVNF